jgi:hypothetical protein
LQRLHNHAFYLYGVLTGLAIREALVRAGPHIFVPSNAIPWQAHLEAMRLVIFLFTISCFYFGAGVYFNKVHLCPETAEGYEKKNYGLDFGMGMVHFFIFFACAIAISDHSRPKWGISPFILYLSAIFLYDLVWLLASIRLDSFEEIKLWAVMCTFVWFLAAVTFLAVGVWKENAVIAEEASFLVLGLYLVGDVIELFTGRPFFLELIKKILPRNVVK